MMDITELSGPMTSLVSISFHCLDLSLFKSFVKFYEGSSFY